MKLYYSKTSPYARKVLVLALEAGLGDRLGLVEAQVAPTMAETVLTADNPLSKVPTLVLASGEALFDSRVIAEFLDSMHSGPALFPEPGPARWTALRQQALGDGALDAAVLTRYESALRPKDLVWAEWTAGQMTKIRRTLDLLEREAADLDGPPTIGRIAVACLLGYLDLRFPEEAWRTGRPNLAAFEAAFAARPSMVQTRPN